MDKDTPMKIACVGAGYFAQLHHKAWQEIKGATLIAVADKNQQAISPQGVPRFTSADALCQAEMPDILDIILPPAAHADTIRTALEMGVKHIICQKPFCTSLAEAKEITARAKEAGARLIIHENFRFQPWYRFLKEKIDQHAFGQIYQFRFALRPGDGRGPDAYLDRQPYFQDMPRFLVHETAVHFLDVFCFLFGKPRAIYADLRRLNPTIAGEDAGLITLDFEQNIQCIFDGNRLADHAAQNKRITMGEAWLEAEAGIIMLRGDGSLSLRPHGEMHEQPLLPAYQGDEFGGGCVTHLCADAVQHWQAGSTPENTADDYLAILELEALSYESAETGQKIRLTDT